MQDKTAIGNNENANTPSKAFREYIESLVEEIVVNNAKFNDHKKYLQRYSQEESLDYTELEKNLTDLFEAFKDLKSHGSNSLVLLVKKLAKDCDLEESTVDDLVSAMNDARKREEEHIAKEEAERKAREDAERKAKAERERKEKEETERKKREKAEREAREEAERIAMAERERKAQEKAEQKTKEEAEKKLRNKKMLDEHPFIDFPNVRKELMNCVGAEDFYGKYYLSYEPILKGIRLMVLRLADVLKDEDVKQSDEYSDFESKANLYLSKTPNSSCSEICQEHGSIKENGEALVRRGENMGNAVRENRKKTALKKLVRRRTWIAVITTLYSVLIVGLFVWKKINNSYSFEGMPWYSQGLKLVFYLSGLIALCLLPFFWSKDFRKEE